MDSQERLEKAIQKAVDDVSMQFPLMSRTTLEYLIVRGIRAGMQMMREVEKEMGGAV